MCLLFIASFDIFLIDIDIYLFFVLKTLNKCDNVDYIE